MASESKGLSSRLFGGPARLVIQWIDFHLPKSLRGPARLGEPSAAERIEDRRRARLIAAVSLSLCLITVAMIPAQITTGATESIFLMCALFALGVGALLGLRSGTAPRVLGNVMLASFYVLLMGFTLASGGEAVGAMVFMVTFPLSGLVLSGRKSAIFWTAAVLIGLGLTAFLREVVTEFPVDASGLSWPELKFGVLFALTAYVSTLCFALEWSRERAQSDAREARQELEGSIARYRSLAETAGDVVAELDMNLRCVYVSPNVSAVSGWPVAELLGDGFIEKMHKDEVRSLGQEMNRLWEDANPSGLSFRFRHRDGHWLSVELSARKFETPFGVAHIVAIARDMSDLRDAELAVRHSERLASMGTLAAGIAHQINNPIGAILNASELAVESLREGDLESVGTALTNNIEQSLRCGKIVRGLLQFAGRDRTIKQPEDLVSIARGACDLTNSYAHGRGLEIELQTSSEEIPVLMNGIEIEQVVVNLLRNAVEAGPRSNHIDLQISRLDDLVRLEVRDDGRGIPEEDHDRVFDPFYTTRIREGGSGLGLSVAHGIVDDQGGILSVEGEFRKGTTMRMELPIAPPEEPT